VPTGDVEDALDVLGCHPMWSPSLSHGSTTCSRHRARRRANGARGRGNAGWSTPSPADGGARGASADARPRLNVPLEWLEPPSRRPLGARLIVRAGERPSCARRRALEATAVGRRRRAEPDVVVFMPSATTWRLRHEGEGLEQVAELRDTPGVARRPRVGRRRHVLLLAAGPRIVDGLECGVDHPLRCVFRAHPRGGLPPFRRRAGRCRPDG